MTGGTSPGKPTGAAPAMEPDHDLNRRGFFSTVSSAAMAGGLALGYGTFVAWAGRFLFPAGREPAWLFVSTVADLKPGDSMAYESPAGVRVVVARRAESLADQPPSADDFISLSSVCPHLGCRVHWEAQNRRFFCPCHNGTFDPEGQATGGPPAVNHQALKRYELLVEHGLIFIQLPAGAVGGSKPSSGHLAHAEEAMPAEAAGLACGQRSRENQLAAEHGGRSHDDTHSLRRELA